MISQCVKQVYIAQHKVDFRKGHQGLLAEAYNLGLRPLEGDAVIFISRDRSRIKVLFNDDNGLWIAYKLFYKGTHKTKFRFLDQPGCKQILRSELNLLLDGARYTVEETKK